MVMGMTCPILKNDRARLSGQMLPRRRFDVARATVQLASISNVSPSRQRGTRFGSRAGTRSHHMPALDSRADQPPAISVTPANAVSAVSTVERFPRQRDRRQALADMLAGLTR